MSFYTESAYSNTCKIYKKINEMQLQNKKDLQAVNKNIITIYEEIEKITRPAELRHFPITGNTISSGSEGE